MGGSFGYAAEAALVPDKQRRKWRPTLGMIVFVVLATVMALPLVGLFFFRLYENQLIRQTESELIAQTAVLAAVFAHEVETTPAARAQLRPQPSLSEPVRTETGDFHPIEPVLDLAGNGILGRRPDASDAATQADPAFVEIGAKLQAIATQAQAVTLAGFRILDPDGTVIGGREELGRSLAHVEEVALALRGQYGSALRIRVSHSPPPPLYSMSRGTSVRVFVAMPVIVDQAVAGVVYASRTPNNIFKHLYGERQKVILAALSIVMVTVLIGFVFSRTIARPIHALIAQTRVIGNGGQNEIRPLGQHGTREVAMLSQSFLDMAARLSERSDYIRTFAAHVSHELKSPLTSIQGAAELLKDSVASQASMSDGQRRHFLDNIIDDTRHLTLLLERLRELARADNPQRSGSTALASVLATLRQAFPTLDVAVDGDQGLASAMSLENAVITFSHLFDNAASHNAKQMRIGIENRHGQLVIDLADDGDGISDANRARIFDQFFTTRRETGGTGMGLGIVQSMLRSHGGSITLQPSSRGTKFRITIPLVAVPG
ncbi:Signal transduction histidine kinase [Rhizobiales bacterium GAS113]|nr:Signal transduction histidine kinase [Rhizobiales bacterium GAS113]